MSDTGCYARPVEFDRARSTAGDDNHEQEQKPTMSLLQELLEAGLTCPQCGTSPAVRDAALSCECSFSSTLDNGVIDLTVPWPEQTDLPSEQAVRGIMHSLGLAETSRIFLNDAIQPPEASGNSFFDAEEALLLERFGLTNFEPTLQLGPAYSAEEVAVGQQFSVAIRVRNNGAFEVSSSADIPVYISYHWLDMKGKVVAFEGARSPLPAVLKPGGEMTVLADITPVDLKPGQHILRFHAIKEMVERYPDHYDHRVSVVRKLAPPPVDKGNQPFSEHFDGQLGAAFLATHLKPDGLVIEIGGGLRPIYYDAFPAAQDALFVNMDASVRLLRMAKHINPREGVMMRANAITMPFADNSASAVIFCRSIHHFPSMADELKEVFRVLRPGGALYLICEPVGTAYDEHTINLIAQGVNEQVFPPGAYERVARETGFTIGPIQVDWGFALKGVFRKP